MQKKYIVCLLSAICIIFAKANQSAVRPAKIEQQHQLKEIIDKINRLYPIGTHLLAVPTFIEFSSQDIERFLSGIPSGFQDSRNKKSAQLSMLEYIKLLWNDVLKELKEHNQITPAARESLINIRSAIETAFHHDLLSNRAVSPLKHFINPDSDQRTFIIRAAPEQALFSSKSVYPVKGSDLNRGFAQLLQSFFSEKSVLEQMLQDALSPSLNMHALVQTLINEDSETNEPIVSGNACSYDPETGIRGIYTITATFGGAKALTKSEISKDVFYVHQDTVYPLVRKKENRFSSDHPLIGSSRIPNDLKQQMQPTLSNGAVLEIARATKLLQESFGQPVCITFIKRAHTIYILKVVCPNVPNISKPSFFDSYYIKNLPIEEKLSIKSLKPHHKLAVIKKRDRILCAPNVRTFVELLAKREHPEKIAFGIIKNLPAPFSSEIRLLDDIAIPVAWSPSFDDVRAIIENNSFPLIADLQQEALFPFKRHRDFYTLFHGVQEGICAHPAAVNISALSTYLKPLSQGERSKLSPDEYYPGVTLVDLFKLLKFDSADRALSAINTLLFRLKNRIALEEITKKELVMLKERFDENPLKRMEELYLLIERAAYQLYTLLQNPEVDSVIHERKLERLFLINILQALVNQKNDDRIVESVSFMQSAKEI